MSENLFPRDAIGSVASFRPGMSEGCHLKGTYHAVCYDADGNEKWRDVIHNTVATVGKNLALDTILAGSSYTVTGPYMGLISSTSFSSITAADTMASHGGWLEAGSANTPHYSGGRQTASFSSASAGSKSLSASLTFTFTGSGTVKGAFMVYGSGASSSVDNTSGTLLSAGLFSGGDKTVASSDTLSVSWSLSL